MADNKAMMNKRPGTKLSLKALREAATGQAETGATLFKGRHMNKLISQKSKLKPWEVSRIWNGHRHPSWHHCVKLSNAFGRGPKWWREASVREIQSQIKKRIGG